MARGWVRWFDVRKGLGFIAVDGGGPDVFVVYTELVGEGFRTLEEGQWVEFDVREAKSGPEAVGVRLARR